jgi:hypothetical protein
MDKILETSERPPVTISEAFSLLAGRIYLVVLKFNCHIIPVDGRMGRGDAPFFLGPALRGAFGHALKEHCCNHPDPIWRYEMKGCPGECDCAYRRVFLSPAPPDLPPPYRGRTYKTHPFSLQAPWLGNVRRDAPFSFEVTLVGDALDDMEAVIAAFFLAGEKGLTTRNWAFRYAVESIHHLKPDGSSPAVWSRERHFATASGSADYLADFIEEKSVMLFKGGVEMRLTAPLYLEVNRKPVRRLQDMDEETLASRAVNNIEELGHFWCGTRLLGGKPALNGGSSSTIFAKEKEDYRMSRLSVESGRPQTLWGLLGSLLIINPRPETVRLLAAMMHIGLGQNRAFGFGRYDLYPLS